MITPRKLQKLAREHGTPLFVIDHDVIRKNYASFRKHLPRVQAYYAVKANSNPLIVKTLYEEGASFDVASMPEFMLVHDNIKSMSAKKRQEFIWDKVIYANPIKPPKTLEELNQYRPLVTYDNFEEVKKIQRYAPQAGMVLRVKVPNTGSVVELSSKFGASSGDALRLIEAAFNAGLTVEGLSFHVGSQCANPTNYVQALQLMAGIFQEAWDRGYPQVKILDIGGGFPVPYDDQVPPFKTLAKVLNAEFNRLFPKDMEIVAEPGRFLVATAAHLVTSIVGKAVRDGKLCYYIDDGVYHTFSGVIFDHIQYHLKSFRDGPKQICSVFGPTCDALDTVSLAEHLPEDLDIGDLLYSDNVGAYTHASSTYFNGFPPATVIHVNR